MPWTIPDKGEGDADLQSVLFQEYLDVLVAGINGTDCVLAGCGVTSNSNMAPSVAKGAVLSNGVLLPVTAGTVTITTADATHPRLDLIVVDSSGAKQVRAGTAAASPKPPARTANDVVLAVAYVPASDTTIASTQITDMRVLRTAGPITVKKTTTAVTFNTTNSIQTYFTITLPSGLFLAGKGLRVRCGGNMLINSGTPTLALTITYGGTIMFADTSGATTGDTDRRPWFLDFDLVAQGNSDQTINGHLQTAPVGGLTPPGGTGAAGIGDVWSTAMVAGAFSGAAAVDSDSADRTLTVQWTMSTSNAANEIVMEYGSAELF